MMATIAPPNLLQLMAVQSLGQIGCNNSTFTVGSFVKARKMNGNRAMLNSESTLTEVMTSCSPPPSRVPQALTNASTVMTVIVTPCRGQKPRTSLDGGASTR